MCAKTIDCLIVCRALFIGVPHLLACLIDLCAILSRWWYLEHGVERLLDARELTQAQGEKRGTRAFLGALEYCRVLL